MTNKLHDWYFKDADDSRINETSTTLKGALRENILADRIRGAIRKSDIRFVNLTVAVCVDEGSDVTQDDVFDYLHKRLTKHNGVRASRVLSVSLKPYNAG